MNPTRSVSIKRRFLRSVNIAKDHGTSTGFEEYVVTPLAQQALSRIAEGLGDSSDRAFTLTGPYGTGKSSFALFLCHLLKDSGHKAWEKLRAVNKPFAQTLRAAIFGPSGKESGYVMLPISSRRTSVTTLLSEALEDAPDDLKPSLIPTIEELRDCTDSKTAVRLVVKASELAIERHYKGLFFIFDEFGKVFEEAYYNRKSADIFILQDLAEAASRSHAAPLFLLGILHQAFGTYVDDIHDTKTKAEFSKIEGRFTPIAFVETPAAQIQLLASAFEHVDDKRTADRAFGDIIAEAKRDPLKLPSIAGLSEHDFAVAAKAVHPLHPLTMIALPLLFRRFGQNERSIFTYLVSNEPMGFQWFLAQEDGKDLLRLADLYDYLLANHETHLSRHPQGKIFLEANDRIHSKPSLTAVDREILKVVAVLTALGMQSHLKASEAMIRFAVSERFDRDVLEHLRLQSVIVYRKFNDSYAIWEGSDVDLLARGIEADRALSRSGLELAATLAKYLPPRPVIAKRHSFKTGALRYFDVQYVDSPDDLKEAIKRKGSPHAVGRVLVCLAQSDTVAETLSAEALSLTGENKSLLFAIPRNINELKEAIREVRRLKWIEENVKELRDDRVARREIAMRSADASQRVTQLQISLLDPRPAPHGSACAWYWNGEPAEEVRTSRQVSELLSTVCDKLFLRSPIIRNELICKRELSSQAAAARNVLVKLLTNPECLEKQYFGIEGFPPERSIYDCLFAASGMHCEVDGQWFLCAPEKKPAVRLLPCWQLLEKEIFGATEDSLPLTELYTKLSAPPYGLLDGIHPVLLTVFYMVNRDEVTLYQEGTYCPDPQEATFELLVRRPDLFAIAGARLQGLRKKIVERLANGLKLEPQVGPIVRHLYKWFASLPKYAKNTTRLDPLTIAFRTALAEARSPEKLLFIDLPKVFDLPLIDDREGDARTFDEYFEKLNQCFGKLSVLLPDLVQEQRKVLLEACRLPNTKEGWDTLYERACYLAPRIHNTELMPFLQTVITTTGDWNKADAVIGAMVSIPMANWGTLELNRFPPLMKGKAELLLDAYRPYAKSPAVLTHSEQKEAEKLKHQLNKSLANLREKPAIVRAALLACLESLEAERE